MISLYLYKKTNESRSETDGNGNIRYSRQLLDPFPFESQISLSTFSPVVWRKSMRSFFFVFVAPFVTHTLLLVVPACLTRITNQDLAVITYFYSNKEVMLFVCCSLTMERPQKAATVTSILFSLSLSTNSLVRLYFSRGHLKSRAGKPWKYPMPKTETSTRVQGTFSQKTNLFVCSTVSAPCECW